jgi:hypothetical protein
MAGIKPTLYIEDGVLRDLEQDIFGHKHIADAVVDSILHTDPPFTIGIFGGWGTGKSSLLKIIDSKLSSNNIATATIDAWRYSSADNLRRAFLVHVANELTPKLLDDLRRKLFSSEQETLPAKPSRLDTTSKTLWDTVWDGTKIILRLASKFIGLFILFFLLLFFVFFTITVMKNSGFSGFWTTFDWAGFQDRFLELAFIPLLLAIVDDLRLYIIQRPVTIVKERIDADELFSQCFDDVVEQATSGWLSKKRLVIFVDNLDRLTDTKMVEALESLKTYLDNPKCVFVVACDDDVVRSVVNNSRDGSKNQDSLRPDIMAGEHYLDKFFQQTFRLPEYMGINLHDFAMKNFESTLLYDELINKKIDIRYLISIILPSDVNSPRKVKRVLNEFIALYEIVKRRESDSGGQLRPGQLSNNVEFLGKYSTLRAEYPEFYQLLIQNSVLLKNITESFQQKQNETNAWVSELKISNLDSLLSYLRKTESILVEDVDSYIWLSQDSLALGLPGNLNSQLRTSLADGNFEQFHALLDTAEDDAKSMLLARVASRMVEQRLVGIEQQNGVKVLAYSLPKFVDAIKFEIAHVAVTLMTKWPIDAFTASEILNILRWAERGGIDQRQKLIDQVLTKLATQETRVQTFGAILDNADVVERNNATDRAKKWLQQMLSLENQTAVLTIDESSGKGVAQPLPSQEFAEWLIFQITNYSNNNIVIDNYFSCDLVDYAVLRVLGKPLNLEGIYLGEAGLGENIDKIFQVLASRVREGLTSSRYWNGILSLVEKASAIEDLQYGVNEINKSINFLPDELIEELVFCGFATVDRLSKETGENKIEDEKLTEAFRQAINLTYNLREKKDQVFEKLKIDNLPVKLSELFDQPMFQDDILNFVDQFSRRFGRDDAGLFVSSLLLVLSRPNSNLELDNRVINKVLDLNNFVSEENRNTVLTRVDTLGSSNDQDKIDCAIDFVKRMISLAEYHERLKVFSRSWIEKLMPEAINVFHSKNKLFDLLIDNNFLNADAYVDRVINLLPLSGDQTLLQIVFDEIENIDKNISPERGNALFSAVLANISLLSAQLPKSLGVAATWREDADEVDRSSFDLNVIALYKSSPSIHLPIHLVSWAGLTADQLKDHIVQIYSNEVDDNLKANRDLATKKALESVDTSERKIITSTAWGQLVADRAAAEEFMKVAVGLLSHNNLTAIRENAINLIRENKNADQSVFSLRLLAVTIRQDIKDVDVVVGLFENLFGRGADEVQMALKYVVQCLKPLHIKKDHKYALAEALSNAVVRDDEETRVIEEKADELELKWFKYKKK